MIWYASFFPVPLISVQITTSHEMLVVGQSSYSLTCGITGAESINSSITYQWTKNAGTQIQVPMGADPKVLSFSPLRLSDAGWYTCQATVHSPYLINVITKMDYQNVKIFQNISLIAVNSVTRSEPAKHSIITPPAGIPCKINIMLIWIMMKQ